MNLELFITTVLIVGAISIFCTTTVLYGLFQEIFGMDEQLRDEMYSFKELSNSAWVEMRNLKSPTNNIRTEESSTQSFHQLFSNRPKRQSDTCSCVETANRCPTGAPGSPGQPGPPGANGTPGKPGTTGKSGTWVVDNSGGCYICPPGPQGDPGDPGRRGIRGVPGVLGQRGTPGMPGQVGYPGQCGDMGQPGKPGLPGQAGHPGREAVTGRGPRGTPGPNGRMGMSGPEGPNGLPSPTGQPGKPGRMGLIGEPGPNGRHGYEGTPGTYGKPGSDVGYCPCPEREDNLSNSSNEPQIGVNPSSVSFTNEEDAPYIQKNFVKREQQPQVNNGRKFRRISEEEMRQILNSERYSESEKRTVNQQRKTRRRPRIDRGRVPPTAKLLPHQ